MPLSNEAGVSTKSDLDIAAATGTVSTDSAQDAKATATTTPAKPATMASTTSLQQQKNQDDKRYDDLEARFAALKRR